MNPNNYDKQQIRAWSRKKELIEMMGGKCCRCGYHKNYSALEFHHIDPKNKGFQLDSRHLSNTSMDKIIEEVKKCVLVCSNCHKEIHYPNSDESVIQNKEMTGIRRFSDAENNQSTCPVCGKKFTKSRGKIFCSRECREKSKGYPSKKEVEEIYHRLGSKEKTAKHFGLTRKIVIDILKK